MLFGNEKRFGKSFVTSSVDKQVMGVKSDATDSSLGPGAYFNTTIEERRGGWSNRSFSRRTPMTPSSKGGRSEESLTGSPSSPQSRDLYQSAVMTSYGAIAMPPSPKHNGVVPGPGYYNPASPTMGGSKPTTPRRAASPSSRTPRFAFSNSTVMKDGIIFQSAENEKKEIGPGYYAVEKDFLNKTSFNVRASKGKNLPPSPGGSRPRTPSTPRGSGNMSRNNSASNLDVHHYDFSQGQYSPNGRPLSASGLLNSKF